MILKDIYNNKTERTYQWVVAFHFLKRIKGGDIMKRENKFLKVIILLLILIIVILIFEI